MSSFIPFHPINPLPVLTRWAFPVSFHLTFSEVATGSAHLTFSELADRSAEYSLVTGFGILWFQFLISAGAIDESDRLTAVQPVSFRFQINPTVNFGSLRLFEGYIEELTCLAGVEFEYVIVQVVGRDMDPFHCAKASHSGAFPRGCAYAAIAGPPYTFHHPKSEDGRFI
jgi:hypothetical protein